MLWVGPAGGDAKAYAFLLPEAMTAMKKLDVLNHIGASKIIATIREDDPEVAFSAAMACIEGGITCLEIALTTPCGLDVIESLAKVDGVIVGAGTVLDSATARSAIQVGAGFVLSPAVDPDVISMCSKYGVVAIPGAFSPTEVVTALSCGADIVQMFPAGALGPGYIETIARSLPQALFMPSGGITLGNFNEWFVKGVLAVGVDGHLTSTSTSKDYACVRAKARRLVQLALAEAAMQA